MLNRTNRTLSANSNRLNLGTRSLALVASVNMGQVLRIRYLHPEQDADTKRAGMSLRTDAMIHTWIPGPGIPGSPPSATSGLSLSPGLRPWLVGRRRVVSPVPMKANPVQMQAFEHFCSTSEPALGRFTTRGQGSTAFDHESAFFKAWQSASALKKG